MRLEQDCLQLVCWLLVAHLVPEQLLVLLLVDLVLLELGFKVRSKLLEQEVRLLIFQRVHLPAAQI